MIYIPESKFKALVQILHSCEVEGISYYEIMGQGKLERNVSEKIVQGYRTNEKFTPEFARRIKVEAIVPDTEVEKIINAIKQDGLIKGKIVISDILETQDL
ncbi:MAG: P-II family nitrogen regulator [Candidatus Nitrosocosmicus sp.]